MRDTFLADAQSALLALLFGDAAKADNELDNLTRDEYRMLIHAASISRSWRLNGTARTQTSLTNCPTMTYPATLETPTESGWH